MNNQAYIRLLNVDPNERLNQRVVYITGEVVNGYNEGQLNVTDGRGMQSQYPVYGNQFKFLLCLIPGHNVIKLNYYDLDLNYTLFYEKDLSKPTYQLVIMHAYDSHLKFDGLPGQPNDLNSAIKRLRMSGYIWQAFIREQMRKHGYGNRTINFKESYQKDTLFPYDINEETADVIIIKSKYSIKEIQDKSRAQQYSPKPEDSPMLKSDKGLFDIFHDTLMDNGFKPGYKVAGLILDSTYDTNMDLVRGHAALGGGCNDNKLAIFGSHTCYSWPENLTQLLSCFNDMRCVDTKYVADECRGTGKNLDSCSIGIGAFLHEVGHTLGLPHVPQGIMSRGFEDLFKFFNVKCPKSNQVITPFNNDNAHFHLTNLIRLRLHSCLALPNEYQHVDKSQNIQVFKTEGGLQIQYPFGIGQYMLMRNDDILYHQHFINELPNKINLNLLEIQNIINNDREVKIEINAVDGQTKIIHNINNFINQPIIQYYNNHAFKGECIGHGRPDNIIPFEFLFNQNQGYKIIIHSGDLVDGIEIHCNNQIVFECGGKGGSKKQFNINNINELIGVEINGGYLVDGFKFLNNNINEWYGGNGGGKHFLYPPKGYKLIGIHGYANNLLYGLGIIYTKL